MSQLDLAGRAGVSARHVSFVESGRAKPSRDMLLVLAEALDVPLRDRNALLEAGGFARVYRETPIDDPVLAGVLSSLEAVIEQTNPFPAVVLDASWVVLRANRAAATLLAMFVPAEILSAGTPNLARLLYSPALRPRIANWPEIGPAFLQRLHREALAGSAATRAIVDDLLAQPDVPERWKHPDPAAAISPVIPLVLEKDGVKLELFTLLSTLGTPVDVTLQELRIETYLPMNAATADALRRIVP